MNATTTHTAVIYDLDDECTWGYSYLARFSTQVTPASSDKPMMVEGRWWFNRDAVEQYARDVVEVDGIDWGVHIYREGSDIDWVSYWTGNGESVPVVFRKLWDVRHIDGQPYWAIPEAWRPLTDVDFADDDA